MKVAVLPGDGIGPEVTRQSLKVLHRFIESGLPMELTEGRIGGDAYDHTGHPLPPETLELARESDAILFGAEGGFHYESLPRGLRPGDGLLTLRRKLDLFANLRPVVAFSELLGVCSVRSDVVRGTDMLIIRELTSDIYFGEPRGERMENGMRYAVNTMYYSEAEIERVARAAFRYARERRKKLCSIDKANVLEVMELWREVVSRVAGEFPDVETTHLYVDAAAMSLIRNPREFDVIVTGNLFGDILSDEASCLAGSIGMLPSASLNADRKGLYEPVHGCAPDIAGQDVANPLGSILSTAMMLRMSFGLTAQADMVERAVHQALADGLRTADIWEEGARRVGTEEMGDAVVAHLA